VAGLADSPQTRPSLRVCPAKTARRGGPRETRRCGRAPACAQRGKGPASAHDAARASPRLLACPGSCLMLCLPCAHACPTLQRLSLGSSSSHACSTGPTAAASSSFLPPSVQGPPPLPHRHLRLPQMAHQLPPPLPPNMRGCQACHQRSSGRRGRQARRQAAADEAARRRRSFSWSARSRTHDQRRPRPRPRHAPRLQRLSRAPAPHLLRASPPRFEEMRWGGRGSAGARAACPAPQPPRCF